MCGMWVCVQCLSIQKSHAQKFRVTPIACLLIAQVLFLLKTVIARIFVCKQCLSIVRMTELSKLFALQILSFSLEDFILPNTWITKNPINTTTTRKSYRR